MLLVSCIIPTKGRPQFVQRAIDCFLSQDWPDKELLILDDLAQRSCPTPPSIPGVTYWQVMGQTIGAKRNLLCSRARGHIIAHLDDDDWSAPGRLTDQVTRLVETGASVTGYNVVEFRRTDGLRWIFDASKRPHYAVGTSLVYLRSWWAAHPFPDVNKGEDNAFVFGARDLVAADARGLMWASIHSGNTCARALSGSQWRKIA